MNVYDSDRMIDVLAPLGYAPTDMADGADMVILNTCHIREKATEKVLGECKHRRSLLLVLSRHGRLGTLSQRVSVWRKRISD